MELGSPIILLALGQVASPQRECIFNLICLICKIGIITRSAPQVSIVIMMKLYTALSVRISWFLFIVFEVVLTI